MMRVDRLVVPAAKSCCSTRSVRRPARAHSRAMATPLIPPPMTRTSNGAFSRGMREFITGLRCALASLGIRLSNHIREDGTSENLPAAGPGPISRNPSMPAHSAERVLRDCLAQAQCGGSMVHRKDDGSLSPSHGSAVARATSRHLEWDANVHHHRKAL